MAKAKTLFCGGITPSDVKKRIDSISMEILRLTEEQQGLRADLQLFQSWEKDVSDLMAQGNKIGEPFLRRCKSLASVIRSPPPEPEDNSKPKRDKFDVPKFTAEVRKLNYQGLKDLGVLFLNKEYWAAFTAEKFIEYSGQHKIRYPNDQVETRMWSVGKEYLTFKHIVDAAKTPNEAAAQPATLPTTQPPNQVTNEVTPTVLRGSQEKRSRSSELDVSSDVPDPKRHHSIPRHEEVLHSFSSTPKSQLPKYLSEEFMQILEQHRTWGTLDATDNFRAHIQGDSTRFEMDWPEHLPEPSLHDMRVFADAEFGQVAVRQVWVVEIKSERFLGEAIVRDIFNVQPV